MKITFPGGLKVQAEYKDHKIMTDQPVHSGGDGTAPSPFDLFLASIGTCVGIYVKSFCEQRGIDASEIVINQKMEINPQTRMIGTVTFEMNLPAGFPEKYKDAVVNTANQCAVKRHIMNPPAFNYVINIANENSI